MTDADRDAAVERPDLESIQQGVSRALMKGRASIILRDFEAVVIYAKKLEEQLATARREAKEEAIKAIDALPPTAASCDHPEESLYYDVYAGDGSGNDGKFVCSKCSSEFTKRP